MHPGVHARIQPSKIAYTMASSGECVTYSQLNARSNQGAHLLRHLGLTPGDGIALLLGNHVAYLQICWAAQRSGLYFTPISVFFQQAEIEFILQNSDARVLITEKRFVSKIDPENLPGITILYVDSTPNWQDEIAKFPSTEIADPCEGAEMIYSSGTTGQPKGVRFKLKLAPLGAVSSLFKKRVEMHNVNETSRYLSTAPLYHSAPLRYNLMVTRLGGSAVIMEKFDAETALQLIDQHAITHSQWVPTMFVRLLRLPQRVRKQYNLNSLKYAIHAAAPCPVDIKLQMIDWWGAILYEYYSGTEANGSTAIDSQQWLQHQGSVGKAIHGELHILDDQGNELPTGEIGTVYFANGSDFAYYKDPEKTAQAKNEHGWSTLGDMGFVDQDGYLYLRDRKSFMIISGGVNIYPQEIENVLINHADVADVAVFGIPNEEFGEEVKAVVQLINPKTASAAIETTLIQYCRDNLSHVKCPKTIDFMADLPRHPTGKLYKSKLRDPYWQNRSTKII